MDSVFPAMTNMVNSASKDKMRMSSSLENVPQLPPLDCAQSYSENPYEIDLSFRQLDILAFKQQQRRSKSEFRNNMSLCTSGVSAHFLRVMKIHLKYCES